MTFAIYFQGVDDKIWVVNSDGTGEHSIPNVRAKSRPFALISQTFALKFVSTSKVSTTSCAG